MPPKKKKGGDEKPFLGRPKNNVKMGIVGLPNVGKSTTFNLMCGMSVAAENFPFCTIDPTESRVAYPDEKYDWLVDLYKPKSEVPAYLTVTDIAGLIRGASEGEGLGNAFLSNILACDAIFHLVRAFSDEEIIHVDGDVNPVRDLETIRNELLIKDMQFVNDNYSRCAAEAKRNGKDKEAQENLKAFTKIKEHMEAGKELRFGDWSLREIDMINEASYLTAKPVVFLVNMSEKNYVTKKNKHLVALQTWIKENCPGETMIPYSASFEDKYHVAGVEAAEACAAAMDDAVKAASPAGLQAQRAATTAAQEAYLAACKEKHSVDKLQSAFKRIIKNGYSALHLHHFFTCGHDEVKCWTIRERTKAPQAAGTIHGDFETHFIKAEIMAYADLNAAGSEAECKAAGKMQLKGKDYTVESGDCIFFHHNATK
jgi:obg-like ATPase 1